MSKTVNVNALSFDKEVIKSEIPVLVDFWAPWCGPCIMMSPVLEEIAEKMKDKVKVAKLNTDEPENQDLAWQYQIQSIPNLKLFKGGKIIKEFIGYRPGDRLSVELEESLKD